jgi:hypothetical protein
MPERMKRIPRDTGRLPGSSVIRPIIRSETPPRA